jgi:hypothetical protein
LIVASTVALRSALRRTAEHPAGSADRLTPGLRSNAAHSDFRIDAAKLAAQVEMGWRHIKRTVGRRRWSRRSARHGSQPKAAVARSNRRRVNRREPAFHPRHVISLPKPQ